MSVTENHIRFTPEPSSPLTVQDVASDGTHTLVLSGELDLVSAPELAATIRHLCVTPTTRALTIDLRKLTFIDSSGLKTMLDVRRLCSEHGQEFRVVPGNENVQRVFEITGMDDLLPFVNA